jgi:cellulose synthase/poly-beta-1,6-N-acetylglucosamine synthase-like glycosyltransferase
MNAPAAALVLAGFAGLAWATVGAPFFGMLLHALFPKNTPSPTREGSAPKLEILIAAHNEEHVIAQTLESVRASAARAGLDTAITVGLDHCTDGTAKLVEDFARRSSIPAKGLANPGKNGKWSVLKFLVENARADWVAVVDSGSVWHEELVAAAIPFFSDPRLLAVAPSYVPQKGGALERFNWRLEQLAKGMESKAGGPISLHGATIFYRLATLKAAMAELGGTVWLNDDVVVPLTLRLRNPGGKIAYLANGPKGGWVGDVGVRAELGLEYRRRRRMIMGNLQWISRILLRNLTVDPAVTCLASRRACRMFWAYFILAIAVGAAWLIASPLAIAAAAGAGLAAFAASNWIRRLAMAFLSGLLVPYYWLEMRGSKDISWR